MAVKPNRNQADTKLWIAALGNRIKHYRLERGMTQVALGKIVGSTAGNWENGASAPASYELPVIASTLGITMGELLGIEAPAPAPASTAAPMGITDHDRQVLKNEIQGMLWSVMGEMVEIITDTAITTLQGQGIIAQPIAVDSAQAASK